MVQVSSQYSAIRSYFRPSTSWLASLVASYDRVVVCNSSVLCMAVGKGKQKQIIAALISYHLDQTVATVVSHRCCAEINILAPIAVLLPLFSCLEQKIAP